MSLSAAAVSRVHKRRRLPARDIGFTLTSQQALDVNDQQIGAFVGALSQAIAACPAMAPADVAGWAGVVQSYATIHANIVATEAMSDVLFLVYKQTRFGILFDQLEALRPQLAAYRARVQAVCGSAPPAPAESSPLPGTNAANQWPAAVKWSAAAVLAIAVAYVASPAVRVWAARAAAR